MTAAVRGNPLLRLGVRAAPRRRLFCMPYAGGGVAPYRLWFKSLPDDIEVHAAQLPGRESRLSEMPLSSIMAMVDTLLPSIEVMSDLPYAIFGHSMGALIAYELTIALERRGLRTPSRLFVSARRPPDEPDTWSPIHALAEPAFLSELQLRYGAIPAPVLAEPELLELMLPVVRADIRAVETYWPSVDAAAQVRCPVTVYGGAADSHPKPGQLALWQRNAVKPVRVRVFPGDHFYLNVQREALTADIAAQWQEPAAAAGPA